MNQAALLGSVLDETAPLTSIHGIQFDDPDHQAVADAIKSLQDSDFVVDIITIRNQLISQEANTRVLSDLLDASVAEEETTDIKPPSQISFTDISHAIANPVQAEWLINGLMEAKTTGAIFGESTSGKSFVAVDLAACVATSTPWIGHKIENEGTVLYFAGEGRHGLPRRFKAWQEEHEVIIPENKLFLPESRIEIAPSGVRIITAAIDELPAPPELIIIDTVARSLPSGSDENSAKDMMEFINAIDEIRDHYGCVIALIHHTGHSETARTRARGSSAFRAAMDWEILIDKKKSAIRWTKMKDSELPEDLSFEIAQVDDSAVFRVIGEVAHVTSGLNKADQLGMDTLNAACDRLNKASVSVHDWRDDFYRRHTGDTTETKRRAFGRTRENLTSKKLVIHDNDIYRPTGQTRTNPDKPGQTRTNPDIVRQCTRTGQGTPVRGVRLSGIGQQGGNTPELEWEDSADATNQSC